MRQIIRVLVAALVLALPALASAQMDKWMAHPDFSRGVDAYDNDEYEEAVKYFSNELASYPDNARMIKARAEYYSDREEYSLAEADLQKLGRLLPGDPYAWFARGVIALAKDELYI